MAAVLLGLALVAWIDLATGEEISVSVLYLLPVSAAAWWLGSAAGLLTAAAAGLAWAMGARAESFFSGRVVLINALLELFTFSLMALMVARVSRALHQERLQAHTDTLTGLSNRRDFYQALAAAQQRLRRADRPFQILYMDLNGFKRVNDRDGHLAGDRVLLDVAAVLLGQRTPEETAARLGGDEFVLLGPPTPGRSQALLDALHQRLAQGGSGVTVSAGELVCTDGALSADQLIQQADALMYEVKRSVKRRGRSRKAPGLAKAST